MIFLKSWRFLWSILIIIVLSFYLTTCQKDSPFQPEPQKHWVVDTTLIPVIISQVDSSHIRSSIQTLQDFGTRYAYSPKCFESAEWIRSELEGYGYSVEYQTFSRLPINDIYFINESEGLAVGSYGVILKTVDGGNTWERKESNTDSHLLRIFSLDGEFCWAWGVWNEYVVLQSKDSGESWERMNLINNKSVQSLFFQTRMKGWMGVGGSALYKTTDGGISWTHNFSGGACFDIYFISDSVGFIGTSQHLYKTTDGGDSWGIVPDVPGMIKRIQFYDNKIGLMVSENGEVIITHDGGETWEVKKVVDYMLQECTFIDSTKFVIMSVRRYLISHDGGLTWKELPQNTYIHSIDFINKQIGFLVGLGIFHKTTDGGLTWNDVIAGLPLDILWNNVKAEKSGRIESDKKIIVGAHYDSRSDHRSYYEAPGANDNASGTAGVLEMARVFKDYDFNRTVEFILFSGEEQGLRGSYYSAAISRQNAEDIVGMINLDMIGYYPDNVYDIGIYSINPDFRSSFIQETTKYSNIIFYEFDKLMSDEKSYFDRDYPALGILEYTLPSVRSYPWYHSVNDKIDKLNMDFTAAVVQFTTGGIFSLITPVVLKPIK